MIFSKQETEQILSPSYSDLVNSVLCGFGKFKSDHFEKSYYLSPTTIANIINDCVKEELKKLKGFSTVCIGKNFFLTYNNFAMRPKKVNGSLCSSNIPTDRVKDIKNQDCILPGLESNTCYLTLGYQYDNVSYELSAVHLIMEESKGTQWNIRIDTFVDKEQMQIEVDKIEDADPKKGRVKIKTKSLPSVAKNA